MSILWIDGFELDRSSGSLSLNYDSPSGWSGAIASTNGRYGGKSLRSETSSASTARTPALPWTQAFSNRRLFVGVALRAVSPGTSTIITGVGESGGLACWTVSTIESSSSTFSLEFKDSDGTLLDTSLAIAYGDWIYLELDTAGVTSSNWEWRINNIVIGSGWGANFLPVPSSPHSTVELAWPSLSSGYLEFDDYYLSEDAYLTSSFVVEGFVPTGDGSSLDWSPKIAGPHYVQVYDSGDVDLDDTYIQTDVDADLDVFTFGMLNIIDGGVYAMRYQVDARNTDATARTITPSLIVEGVPSTSEPGFLVDAQTYQRFGRILPTNPVDSSTWQIGDFAGISLGAVKGAAVNIYTLPLQDEDQTAGYFLVEDISAMIPLFDEAGVAGQLATHDTNTNLKILDEDQIEGDFPLTVTN